MGAPSKRPAKAQLKSPARLVADFINTICQKQKSAQGKSSLQNLATLSRAKSILLAFYSFIAPVIAET